MRRSRDRGRDPPIALLEDEKFPLPDAKRRSELSTILEDLDNNIAIEEDGETYLNADCHTANRSTLVPNTYRDHEREASYKRGRLELGTIKPQTQCCSIAGNQGPPDRRGKALAGVATDTPVHTDNP